MNTKVIKFFTDLPIAPNTGGGMAPVDIDGFRYINIMVKFPQETANEQPVDLGVLFGFPGWGTMISRCYVNLEQNVQRPQTTNFIEVSGGGNTWHGQPKMSTYIARLPVMGPWVNVVVYNRASVARKVSAWAYLTE